MDPLILAAIDKCVRYCCPFAAYAYPGQAGVNFHA